ncbi:MAG TPA: PHP domain-containing protein [Clostridia bacterium]|nr:PHP domain-containing protein [Clostridia bacterium]
MKADLHLHTTASDGEWTPEAVVCFLASMDYDLIAITDHDTIKGIEPAMQAAGRLNGSMRVLPGVELSAGGEAEVHLLAYGIPPSHPKLADFLDGQRAKRRARILEMLERLSKMGKPLELSLPEDLEESAGRPHIARALVREGYVADVREAFERFLAQGKPAYVPRETPPVAEAIECLRACGGVVCLAHPGQLTMGWEGLMHCLPAWKAAGLQGLEAHHSAHSADTAMRLDRLARQKDLLVTGGSDFHGLDTKRVRPGDGLAQWIRMKTDVEALLALMPPF